MRKNLLSQGLIILVCLTSAVITIKEIQGFSMSNGDPANRKCFKYSSVNLFNTIGELKYEGEMSYASLYNSIEKEVKYKGWHRGRRRTKTSKFFRSIFQQSFGFNMNYIFKLNSDFEISYEHLDENQSLSILTDIGRKVYNNGKNPLFDSICGGYVFTSGKLENILAFNVSIQLDSKEKYTYKEGNLSKIGGINELMRNLNKGFAKLPSGGTVYITGHQIGGNPDRLNAILPPNGENIVNRIGCSIKNLNACIAKADELINYAKNDFPKQIEEFKNNINSLDGFELIGKKTASVYSIRSK